MERRSSPPISLSWPNKKCMLNKASKTGDLLFHGLHSLTAKKQYMFGPKQYGATYVVPNTVLCIYYYFLNIYISFIQLGNYVVHNTVLCNYYNVLIFYLTFIQLGKSVKNKLVFTMMA